ncbi:GvpL/GvpF family gas vesicle protein [Streptomyces sp. NPDC051219]|uniref:GvpL/GvpF family gas vesicle protein n=1 Tax=Streptomyces sp. NPDC051219 TaxID=3155283 RepID=UPI003436792F
MTAPTASETHTSTALATDTYVFAVCRRTDPAALTRLPGLAEGAPVRALPFRTLVAVVQDVPSAEFCAQAWQERLADPADLERCARAHHEVVCAVAATGPTVPLALATLYHGDERARQALAADAARFRAAIARITGRVEWGVKVYAPRQAPSPGPVSPAGQGPAPAGAGRAYLERMRNQHHTRRERQDAALRIAEDVDTVMRGMATDARRLRTHEELPAAGGGRRTQILNAAYLVEESRADDVAVTVETLRRRTGADIELSGPWVPYSFAGGGMGDADN